MKNDNLHPEDSSRMVKGLTWVSLGKAKEDDLQKQWALSIFLLSEFPMYFLEKEDQPHFLYRQEGQKQFSSSTEENTKPSKKNVQKWAIVSAVRRLSRQAVKKHSEILNSEL